MSFAEIFEEAFVYYLSIGMDYETYWERSPQLVKAYREANELSKERKNQELWIQGFYNYQAFQSAINTFSWGLGGGKGAKPEPYLEYPIAITQREKEIEKERNIANTLAWVKQGQI